MNKVTLGNMKLGNELTFAVPYLNVFGQHYFNLNIKQVENWCCFVGYLNIIK